MKLITFANPYGIGWSLGLFMYLRYLRSMYSVRKKGPVLFADVTYYMSTAVNFHLNNKTSYLQRHDHAEDVF